MKIVRVGLHSLVLVVADLAGIGLGAVAAYGMLGAANQIMLQLPISVALTIGFFCVWVLALRTLAVRRLVPLPSSEMNRCLAASAPAGPAGGMMTVSHGAGVMPAGAGARPPGAPPATRRPLCDGGPHEQPRLLV